MSNPLNESIDLMTRFPFKPSLFALAMAMGALCAGITVAAQCGGLP